MSLLKIKTDFPAMRFFAKNLRRYTDGLRRCIIATPLVVVCLCLSLGPEVVNAELVIPNKKIEEWNDRLRLFFLDFHVNGPSKNAAMSKIYKWMKPIRVLVLNLNDYEKANTEHLIQTIKIGTQLEISIEDQGTFNAIIVSSSNIERELVGPNNPFYRNFFSDDQLFENFVIDSAGSNCRARLALYEQRIQGMLIFVKKSESQKKYMECILPNFVAGLGFQFNSGSTIKSILSNIDFKELGPIERKAIQLLYSNKIVAGMSISEFYKEVGIE